MKLPRSKKLRIRRKWLKRQNSRPELVAWERPVLRMFAKWWPHLQQDFRRMARQNGVVWIDELANI